MPDQISGQNPSGDTDQSSSPPPVESTIEQRIGALETQSRACKKDEKPNSLAKSIRNGEWWLIGINGFLLIATIVIACIYNGQLTEMRRATYISCVNSQIARRTLLEIQAGGADSHNLATGSILQAAAVTRGEAAQIVIKFRNAGRAIQHETGAMGIQWGIENIGQTAANRVRVHLKAVVVDKDREPNFRYESYDFADIGTFPPTKSPTPADPLMAQPLAVLDGKVPKIFSQQEILQLLDGSTERIFFYARVDYVDIFGVEHWSKYCGESIGKFPVWKIPKCAAYNRTDTNQVIANSTPAPATLANDPGDISCKKPEE